MKRIPVILSMLALPLLADAPKQVRYDCQTGEFLMVRYQPGDTPTAMGRVTLEVTGKPPLSLLQVMSASGARYSDGYTVLWNKGTEVTLESGDFHPKDCKERPAAPAAGQDNSLLGSWRLVQIGGRAAALDHPAYIEFQPEGKAAGNLGCNRFTGTYQVIGSELKMGPTVSTKMACLGAGMDVETQFAQALIAAASWRVTGGDLTLLDSGGKPLGAWTKQ